MGAFSFLNHMILIEDDSSRYEVGIGDDGFSYLDLVSEKKANRITFEEKQKRETSAALDGSTRARGQSNLKRVESIDHDEVCFDTDLLAILRDIETRRGKMSVFPWVLSATCLIVIAWLRFVLYSVSPLLIFVTSSLIVLPILSLALVNTWYIDRSRKHVQFRYKISGAGEVAFKQLNNAFEAISESGQALLYAGRKHFEDTRYSGGAGSIPDFKQAQYTRGQPPLLDLDFDVWRIRAFGRDLYFMPDHVLIFDGANIGGG